MVWPMQSGGARLCQPQYEVHPGRVPEGGCGRLRGELLALPGFDAMEVQD